MATNKQSNVQRDISISNIIIIIIVHVIRGTGSAKYAIPFFTDLWLLHHIFIHMDKRSHSLIDLCDYNLSFLGHMVPVVSFIM